MNDRIDLSKFTFSNSFYDELELVLTVKNFNLQEIRERYLKSKKQGVTGKTGSVERRKPSNGGIVRLKLKAGKVLDYKVIKELKEPRGIVHKNGIIAFSAENEVYIVRENKIEVIKNKWFSYIHTLDFNEDASRILISSSGFDCIFEYDIDTLEKTYEWFAWENGFNIGHDPKTGNDILLSREPVKTALKNVVITDPNKQVLPTAMRAAFINSVVYDAADYSKMLATFFHEGKVYSIDMKSGKSTTVISNMRNPHGGMRIEDGTYMATSTGTGEVVSINNMVETRFLFKELSGKPKELGDMEWLQNSKVIESNIITIDSNRTSFVIFNAEKKLIDTIAYDANLAIQDMVECTLSNTQEKLITSV